MKTQKNMLLQASMHIFTDRPDLARDIFIRDAEIHNEELQDAKLHDPELQDAEPVTIIVYPHATSDFVGKIGLSDWYAAETASRRRGKCPALVSVFGIYDVTQPLHDQILRLNWAFDGKYVCAYEFRCLDGVLTMTKEAAKRQQQRYDALMAAFPILQELERLGEQETPTQLVKRLNEGVGVYVGGTDLERFLQEQCVHTTRKNFPYGKIFKVRDMGTVLPS